MLDFIKKLIPRKKAAWYLAPFLLLKGVGQFMGMAAPSDCGQPLKNLFDRSLIDLSVGPTAQHLLCYAEESGMTSIKALAVGTVSVVAFSHYLHWRKERLNLKPQLTTAEQMEIQFGKALDMAIAAELGPIALVGETALSFMNDFKNQLVSVIYPQKGSAPSMDQKLKPAEQAQVKEKVRASLQHVDKALLAGILSDPIKREKYLLAFSKNLAEEQQRRSFPGEQGLVKMPIFNFDIAVRGILLHKPQAQLKKLALAENSTNKKPEKEIVLPDFPVKLKQ